MKINHIFTLFSAILILAFFLVSCAAPTEEDNGETNMNGETNTDETNGDTGDGGDGGDGNTGGDGSDGGDGNTGGDTGGDGGDGGDGNTGGDGGDGGDGDTGGDGGDGGDGNTGDGDTGDGDGNTGDGDGNTGDGDGNTGDGDGNTGDGDGNTGDGDGDGGDGDGNTGDGGDGTGSFEASDVSAQLCTNSLPTLNCFISVWDTSKIDEDRYAADHASKIVGASDNASIKLPLWQAGSYDFYVNWGDDSPVERIMSDDDPNAYTPEATHTYSEPGTYTVYIAGKFEGWRFNNVKNSYGDAVKLLNIKKWGPLSLGSTGGFQFKYAENFNPTATDAPDLSKTSYLTSTFEGASNFNGVIGNWNVSTVTDMTDTFRHAINFNQDISKWNVLEVRSMGTMFQYAASFNNGDQPFEWGENTRNVLAMSRMFQYATNFNQDISKWNVSSAGQPNNFADESGIADKPDYLPKFNQ